MKKCIALAGLAAAYVLTFGTSAAWAEPVVVSGGTWSAADVTEGADVVVSGETENDIDGLSVNSLTFTGRPGEAVSLSGKGLTVVSAVPTADFRRRSRSRGLPAGAC